MGRLGPSTRDAVNHLILVVASLGISALIAKFLLRSIDLNPENSKAALKRRREIQRRLGKAIVTNQYEVNFQTPNSVTSKVETFRYFAYDYILALIHPSSFFLSFPSSAESSLLLKMPDGCYRSSWFGPIAPVAKRTFVRNGLGMSEMDTGCWTLHSRRHTLTAEGL